MVEELSETRVKEIIRHMNEDHQLSIFAILAKELHYGPVVDKITSYEMTSVSLQGFKIQYVVCDGATCSMEVLNKTYYGDESCSHPGEIRSKMVEEHHQALTPNISQTLVTNLDGLTILIVTLVLAYLTFDDRFIPVAIRTFDYIIKALFYVTVVAHILEGLFVFYKLYYFSAAKSSLKITFTAAIKWAALTACCGWVMTKKVLKLIQIANSNGHDEDDGDKNTKQQ